jgi:hypothetical protein
MIIADESNSRNVMGTKFDIYVFITITESILLLVEQEKHRQFMFGLSPDDDKGDGNGDGEHESFLGPPLRLNDRPEDSCLTSYEPSTLPASESETDGVSASFIVASLFSFNSFDVRN